MGFKVVPASEAPSGGITSDRRLFLADDEKTLVEDGDPRARWLLCAPGNQIPAADAKRLELAVEDGHVVQRREGESKERQPGEDKQRSPTGNKGKSR